MNTDLTACAIIDEEEDGRDRCDDGGGPGVEKTEVLVRRLVICGVIWTQLSAYRWGTRVWEVNDE